MLRPTTTTTRYSRPVRARVYLCGERGKPLYCIAPAVSSSTSSSALCFSSRVITSKGIYTFERLIFSLVSFFSFPFGEYTHIYTRARNAGTERELVFVFSRAYIRGRLGESHSLQVFFKARLTETPFRACRYCAEMYVCLYEPPASFMLRRIQNAGSKGRVNAYVYTLCPARYVHVRQRNYTRTCIYV